MFITILVIILTIISISLKLIASSIDLSIAVARRIPKDTSDKSKVVARKTVRVGLRLTSLSIRLASFVIARVRDLLSIGGIFVLIIGIIIFVVIFISVSVYSSMYM